MPRSSFSFASGALIYAGGQLANVLFQLLLLKHFGQSTYAEIGLAHLLVLSTLFIGDLGYSSLFLREHPDNADWQARWRQALLHRLILTLLLDALLLLGWAYLYSPNSASFAYLLGAMPTTLFGLINYSAPLLVQGRRHLGFIVQQLAWPSALAAGCLLQVQDPTFSAGQAGILISFAYLLQALFNITVFGHLHLLLPKRCESGSTMLRSALHLSLMGVAGTLHDRLTPFLIAQITPSFTAAYLLICHILNGATGVFNQFNRLILAEANTNGLRWTGYLSTLLLIGLALSTLLIHGVFSHWPATQEMPWLHMTFPVLVGWGLTTLGSLVCAVLISRGQERKLLRILILGLLISTLLQSTAVAMNAQEWLLWARAMGMMYITMAVLKLCQFRLAASGISLLAATSLCSIAHLMPAAWWLALGLFLIALLLVWRQPLGLLDTSPSHLYKRSALSPAAFQQALQRNYGDEVSRLRHELFFLNQHPHHQLNLRSFLAALRDAGHCLMLPRRVAELPKFVAVASLTGSSGREALEPCLTELKHAAHPCAVVIHPRLLGKVAGFRPASPGLIGWYNALRAWSIPLCATIDAPIPAWPVRCALFRHRLWLAAWQRTLMTQTNAGTLLLHNDFDMFAVAAIEAGRERWRSICVQHGLPTDEFAPPRAEQQLVWGASSRSAYINLGFSADNLLPGPSRTLSHQDEAIPPPRGICIISQTHTPIFGRSLSTDFAHLAQALLAGLGPQQPLSILLHPGESQGAPSYPATLHALCKRPPHSTLNGTGERCIVVGFCSTALLEAACHGHLVIGMDWQVTESLSALLVGQPPHRVGDCNELLVLINALSSDFSHRQVFLQRQRQWLSATFNHDDACLDWIGAT